MSTRSSSDTDVAESEKLKGADFALPLRVAVAPFAAAPQYLAKFAVPQRVWLVAAYFVAASAVFGAAVYPLSAPEEESRSAGIYALRVLDFVFAFTIGNLFYALFIDFIFDFRMRKKLFRRMILSAVGISATFSIIGAVGIAAIFPLIHDLPVRIALVVFVFWWQWLIEAIVIRVLYDTNLILAFGNEILVRIFSTALMIIFYSVLVGEISKLLEKIRSF